MDVQAILDLMKEMKHSGIENLEWQADGQTLRLVRPQPIVSALTVSAGSAGANTAAADAVEDADAAPAVESIRREGRLVTSPVVGVFFAAPAPDQDAFVSLGSAVETGAPLGIIEAMKLMNEVVSPCGGTVVDILVENGQRVEYGQPLFVIKESRR